MPLELRQTYISESVRAQKREDDGRTYFRVDKSGRFLVLHPGPLVKKATASYKLIDRTGPSSRPDDGERQPTDPETGTSASEISEVDIPLTLRLFTPDGIEFTAGAVTLADLRRTRDLRGTPLPWRYKLTGESEHFILDEGDSVFPMPGEFIVAVDETVGSESAPPLVDRAQLTGGRQTFEFDLFRVGRFAAQINVGDGAWRGALRLIDPDGTIVATSNYPQQAGLSYEVTLPILNKSRDAQGKVRKWSLRLIPSDDASPDSVSLSATVIGTLRVNTAVIKSRIDRLLGPDGAFVEVYGENKDGRACARLRINDIVAAETIDLFGLLDDRLAANPQDEGVEPNDVEANTPYTIFSRDEVVYDTIGAKLKAGGIRVGKIKTSFGRSDRFGERAAVLKMSVEVKGEIKIEAHGFEIGTGRIRDGKIEVEIGIVLRDGIPELVSWSTDRPLDIDTSRRAIAAAAGLGGIAVGALISKIEKEEREQNAAITSGIRALAANATLAPRILMLILGGRFDYRAVRFEGDDILFDHVAPLEPDPRPRTDYSAVIGRKIVESGIGHTMFDPSSLGDTWAAEKLMRNIEHVVVVMMENRSYDHVLGYRALGQRLGGDIGVDDDDIANARDVNIAWESGDGSDGLTLPLLDAIEAVPSGLRPPYKVRQLRHAEFARNPIGLRTRLPKGVGHEFVDVQEQLSEQTDGPDGSRINSPKGFVENFKPRIGVEPMGVVLNDVLGYYDAKDLPFFAYLATHYSYSDRYFCSHPGPTLPNRMYQLTGDVQHDRYGATILENNHGDNFLLSRAQTIYDLLTRKGVSWRVYESEPSVTMLRMFARYATDDAHIVPIAQLAADVENDNLPSFVSIEPAMHHHPQDDDHPDADMYRGQIFLQNVYKTLRKKEEIWKKTLLIITYDEHGGLYDHVVPPVADIFKKPIPDVVIRDTADPGETDRTVPGSANERGPRDWGVHIDLDNVIVIPEGGAPSQPEPHLLLKIPYGVRVPTFVVSPWSMPGKGPGITLDHCSILKTVLARFLGDEQPFMGDRVHASNSFEAFLTADAARVDVPDPAPLQNMPPDARRIVPGASRIETPPLKRKQMRDGPVDFHELTGRLARILGR